MYLDTATAEKVAENSWFKLLGRTVMLLMVPALVWAWSWGASNTRAIAEIDKRVERIEDNQDDLAVLSADEKQDRIKFQDNILKRLDQILNQLAVGSERLTRIETQIEERATRPSVK